MLPITRKISAYNHSDGNTMEYIVMHDTGNVTDTDEGNAEYFGEADRQASANYFVDDDSITQVVEDFEASWNCGDGHDAYGIGNHNSIGIEMCRVNNVVTATTEANTIELVKYLMAKYNIPIEKVVRHYDASRKICPSSFSDDNWARWFEFKAKLGGASVSTPIQTTSSGLSRETIIRTYQHLCNICGIKDANGNALSEDGIIGANTRSTYGKMYVVRYGSNNSVVGWVQTVLGLKSDNVFGNNTDMAVRNYQKAHSLYPDGVVGPNTLKALVEG